MKYLAILAAAAATPAVAQPAPVAAPAPAAAAAPDAERLALARVTAESLWPQGTYARLLNGSMDQMMDSVMASLMDMKLSDVVPPAAAAKNPAMAQQTFRAAAAKADPHFQERMRIMNHVMMSEMAPIFTRIEPDLREGLARAYAVKFSADQLRDMNHFFATPSGHAYASEAMITMMDPQVMSQVMKAMPELMQAMPQIMEKMQKATAHLPLPKKGPPAAKP